MTICAPSCLDRVLAPGALTALFQPIVERRADGCFLRSVEGLVRGPQGSTVEPAEVLFDYTRRKGAEAVVDRACVSAVLAAAEELPSDLDFAVNVHAVTLARDPEFVAHLLDEAKRHGVAPARVTVEIVEHSSEWMGSVLTESLDALRHIGVAIALDDIGLGQSNFRMVVDCRPDCLKIDRYFCHGVHGDPYRQAVVRSVAVLARSLGARVVAEGIETVEDLETAGQLGVTQFQGFLFSRPVPAAELARAGVAPWRGGFVAAEGRVGS